VRTAFEVAQHKWRSILFRQPVYLLVDNGTEFRVPRCLFCAGPDSIRFRAALFINMPSDHIPPQGRRRAAGDLMEPWAEGVSHPKGPRLADQDEERRLKGIFRRMPVAQNCQADAPNHRLMPLDKRRKRQFGQFVGIGCESFQELAV
jgi:hypothetical protein